MIKVSIIGASGYTGAELMRLLVNHPEVDLQDLTARSLANQPISHHFPYLAPALADKKFVEMDLDQIKSKSDLVYICLPHGHSMEIGRELFGHVRIIDMGADFRLRDIATYEKHYEVEQKAPDLLEQAVYGLTEFYRDEIKMADLIANPGCFVTNAILALMPLVDHDLIDNQSIIIDSKTGISGAGRSAKIPNLLAELGNSYRAYNPFGHRHIPEIEQELQVKAKDEVMVQFTPQLLPTERGIFSSIYANGSADVTTDDLHQVYKEYYQGEEFIQVLDQGLLPELKAVRGSNYTHLQVQRDPRSGRILVLSALDNLMKGASGQAVQNMNVMYGFEENMGLQAVGLMP